MANRISKTLKKQKKGFQFLKNYSRHKYFKGKPKKEFNDMLDHTISQLVSEKYRHYFNRTRLRNLLSVYSVVVAWLLSLLILVSVMLHAELHSSIMPIYKKNIFLIVLFFILGLFGFALANLLINIARFNLWKQIIKNNQIIILESLLAKLEIKHVYFLPSTKHHLVVEVKPLKMLIPKNKNNKTIKVLAKKNIENSIYFNDKKLISTFSEVFINQQIKNILVNKKMHAVFKEINLNFEASKKGQIILNIKLNLHLTLIIIFITSIFVIYTFNSQKK